MPMRYRITDSKKKKKLIECLKKYDRKRFLSTVTYRLMPWKITVQQQTVNCVHFPEVFLPGKKKSLITSSAYLKKQCPQFPFVDCTQVSNQAPGLSERRFPEWCLLFSSTPDNTKSNLCFMAKTCKICSKKQMPKK